MINYIVQYWCTIAARQPFLKSLTNNVAEAVYKFETTNLEEAIEIANKEIEVSGLTKINNICYDISNDEFYRYATWVEILKFDESGELIGEVYFKSPIYWLEDEI